MCQAELSNICFLHRQLLEFKFVELFGYRYSNNDRGELNQDNKNFIGEDKTTK